MSRWERWLSRRARSVLILAVAVVAAGAWVCAGVPLEWSPKVEHPEVIVVAMWPGASPTAVERYVTAPVERALQGIAGTAGVESYSRPGQSVVRLEASQRVDPRIYASEISDRLSVLRRTLPAGVVPRLAREPQELFEEERQLMVLEVVGRDPRELRRVAEQVLAPRLRSLSGISRISIEGGEEEELLIRLDPDRLRLYGVAVPCVRLLVAEALTGSSYGSLHGAAGRGLILRPARGIQELGAMALAPECTESASVRLGDVARISLSTAPVQSISRVDGKPVVTLVLERAPGSSLFEAADAVRGLLGGLQPELPAEVRVAVVDDHRREVVRELKQVARLGGLGLILVLGGLAAAWRSWRALGVVAFCTAAPLSGALIAWRALGFRLNLVALPGAVLLAGALAVGTILALEQILGAGRRGLRSVPVLLQEISVPLAGCTVSTAAAFLVLLRLDGELGELLACLAILAALTLLFSLASVALLIPILLEPTVNRVPRPARKQPGFFCSWAARHPRPALLALLLIVGLPTPLVTRNLPALLAAEDGEGWSGAEIARASRWIDRLFGGVTALFLDRVELGQGRTPDPAREIAVRVKLPLGSPIHETDLLLSKLEQRVQGSPAVQRTITRVAGSSAHLRVLFSDEMLARPEPFALRESLIAQAVRQAGADVSISGLSPVGFDSGFGNVTGFGLDAYGPNYDRLARVVEEFARRLARYPRVAGVEVGASRSSRESRREVIRFHWSAGTVARAGIPARTVANLLQSHLFPVSPAFHASMDGIPRLPVRLAASADDDLFRLLGRSLEGEPGHPFRLADLADVDRDAEPAAIERKDQQYRQYLRVLYRGPSGLGMEMLDAEMAATSLPAGYRLEHSQETRMSDPLSADTLWLVAGTAALVFLGLAVVFESWHLAGLAMACLPFAWIGAALGFVLKGESFGEGGFLGLILLAGLAVHPGVLLAGRVHQLRRSRPHAAPSRLALLAVRQRGSAIRVTSLAVAGGMVPVLVMAGAGGLWEGAALTVISGLLGSALLSPAAMVALLSVGDRART